MRHSYEVLALPLRAYSCPKMCRIRSASITMHKNASDTPDAPTMSWIEIKAESLLPFTARMAQTFFKCRVRRHASITNVCASQPRGTHWSKWPDMLQGTAHLRSEALHMPDFLD